MTQSGKTFSSNMTSTDTQLKSFDILDSIQQRHLIQTEILGLIKRQIEHYSQRHLSTRGRATIMNTLILSQIWYSLRLMAPTKDVLMKIQSLTYQFIWKGKHPWAALNQLG
ncbi:unnamed protein product [Absidia cylindrospora]